MNLTHPQMELLTWHYHLGHVGMHCFQRLIHHDKELDNHDTSEVLKLPTVISSKHKGTSMCSVPFCAACILGKMERVPNSSTITRGKITGKLCRDDLLPGDCISMDQYVVKVPGRSLNNSSNTTLKFNGGTIFIDHASNMIFLHNQISLHTSETLIGKRLLERSAHNIGHSVKHFHANNGVFASQEFRVEKVNYSLLRCQHCSPKWNC